MIVADERVIDFNKPMTGRVLRRCGNVAVVKWHNGETQRIKDSCLQRKTREGARKYIVE